MENNGITGVQTLQRLSGSIEPRPLLDAVLLKISDTPVVSLFESAEQEWRVIIFCSLTTTCPVQVNLFSSKSTAPTYLRLYFFCSSPQPHHHTPAPPLPLMSNTAFVSSLPLSLPNSDLWTMQSARHAVVAARLISGKAPRHGSSRRYSTRLRPSPLGRSPPWTLTSEVPTALATTAYQPSRSRITLGLGHPSHSSKRGARVESSAPACSQPAPSCNRTSLGLGHPTTSARRHATPVEPITIAPSEPTQQPRGRANIGLGHASTSPRRPVAPTASQPSAAVIPTPRKRSYAQTLVHDTPNGTTGKRVTPTRCAVKEPSGVSVSLITALALRSTSSGTSRAGPAQVHSLGEVLTERQDENELGGCEIVGEDELIQLAARIEFRRGFAGRGMNLLF
ncbi:hypothetical protein C8R47DRAFT_1190466 [Mycena vitilis]|nr:hypothetical protein C8R47DRAFT_1190466 [Mycena vitilis]